jgi:Succinate dehydrogenase/fumarate reductase, flavoprotein subunit
MMIKEIYTYNTLIIGSGAAGLNCADTLYNLGQTDIAIITEGINMGTSRNTGSDKQTYYKLTMTGSEPDSVYAMAQTLFDGGSMHGDIALTEAAGSVRSFCKLTDIGVPFPFNEYGEYAGYKTDHDPRSRATSCGPLTSKYMTEALEKSIKRKDIKIFDGYRVVKILTENSNACAAKVCGILAVKKHINNIEFTLFRCTNLVYATGGPSAIYDSTVYPQSQTCAHGTAFLAGAEGINLTESQYGIASVKFRWNLSGTYQQVIPRYISIDDNGNEYEFLNEHFTDTADMLNSIFLKGYQWPFDPRKLNGGSSRVDMAVYYERLKNRKIYLDFTRNPSGFDFSLLNEETYNYLSNSNALLATPIERLRKMNTRAIELYSNNDIDICNELLEINVCAQHNNGGFSGDTWYESTSLRHFFPVGEVNGVFGVYRPGGSALNSTQVSSMRAAYKIAREYNHAPNVDSTEITIPLADSISDTATINLDEILNLRQNYGKRMDNCGAFIRNAGDIVTAIDVCKSELDLFGQYKVNNVTDYIELSINYDILITQYIYLSAILEYINHGGKSRGSYLINGDTTIDELHTDKVCYASFDNNTVKFRWENVRPIPESEQWFETIYNRK